MLDIMAQLRYTCRIAGVEGKNHSQIETKTNAFLYIYNPNGHVGPDHPKSKSLQCKDLEIRWKCWTIPYTEESLL